MRCISGMLLLLTHASLAYAMDVVRDGKPVAPIVIHQEAMAIFEKMKATKNCIVPDVNKVYYYVVVYGNRLADDPVGQERMREVVAALLVQEWVKRITDADLSIVVAAPSGPAIFVGQAEWPAPIRFCRWHRIGNPDCPSRHGFKDVVEGWSAIVPHLGYREFNFNLPDMLVPFSKMHVWKHDIPYLYRKGLMALDIETWIGPGINGPHIFLSTQLGYDPELDVDALMHDYFAHYYGAKAGPMMEEYWMNVDRAYQNLTATHTGCYFSIPHVYTKDFRAQQRSLIDRALKAAAGDKMLSTRIQLDADALTNAGQFTAIIDALYDTMDFASAERTAEDLDRRNKEYRAQGKVHKYTSKFIRRFFGRNVSYITRNATKDGGKLVYMLPDEWKLKWDDENTGVAKGYWKKDFDDSDWVVVKTRSKTLRDQGQPERLTYMWYRTTLDVPKDYRRLRLAFMEIDGSCQFYINGKKVLMDDLDFPYWEPDTKRAREQGTKEVWSRSRKPTLVDITDHVKPGKNSVAVHVDHTHITEIFLGGIVRPVYLFDVPTKLHEDPPADAH